ncbi:kinase-like protein [Exidia glandulosa HHB12029]|uniref:Kinase-like protein n=1 Tax=Exidia glandulosa HHB12029 TaxID=1314781 RepID=A0A165BGP7_EXIGL|nr:kinase-like protein [Exidia glandulosa HHB12029]
MLTARAVHGDSSIANTSTFSASNVTQYIRDVSLRPVRHGGPSDIYMGRCSMSSGHIVKVALKVHRVAGTASAKLIRRLNREISVWQNVNHPCIHPFLGLYWGLSSSSLPAMVSPWCQNGDIMSYLAARERSGVDISSLKLDLLVNVLQGLQYLHGRNIVHADIKGANVLVSDDGVARLCDFGFSSMRAEHAPIISSDSSMKGTYRWMAPELFAHDRARHTKQSDIWASGCLFLEVQSGRVPYHTKYTDQAVIIALSNGELPIRPGNVSDPLWRLVQACCVTNPTARPSVDTVLQRMLLVRIGSGPEAGSSLSLDALSTAAVLTSVSRRVAARELLDMDEAAALLRISQNGSHAIQQRFGTTRSPVTPDPSLTALLRLCITKAWTSPVPSKSDETATLVRTAEAVMAVLVHFPAREKYLPSELQPLASLLSREDVGRRKSLISVFSSGASRF